ncbi:thioester reductase [Streptomyces griseocarneus]|nr:thioester reductase [Streptomyces griseocarneus]
MDCERSTPGHVRMKCAHPEGNWMIDQKSAPSQENSTACLHDLFAEYAAAAPDAVAVVHGDRSVTYGELGGLARRLAARLRAQGVGPDVVVGLYAERSVEMIVGALGILEAGGAYLPLRTDDPVDRVSFILADSGAGVVVTSRATHERLRDFTGVRLLAEAPGGDEADGGPAVPDAPVVRANPENLAYVIYTSGTTGAPKGVAVPHRAARRILRTGIYGDFDAGQTFLQACPLSFDASVLEVWGSLTNGARLVLLPDARVSAEAIMAAVRRHDVTTLWLTPTLFNQIVDLGMLAGTPLRQIVVGGEVLSTSHLAEAMRTTDIRFSNGYGPTEAGVFTCVRLFEEADLAFSPPPVGAPLPGTAVRVLDEEMRPLPDGELGELYIGGDALAHGYHRRPDLTAKAFVENPFPDLPGAVLYRSGDLARVLPGGLIQVVGRIDTQVKIRGNRVELGEVEAALLADPSVRQAAVVDRQNGAERVLAAHVVPAEGATPTVSDLRRRLAETLPDYMVPSEFFRIGEVPLTRNGKADRAALREGVAGAERLELGVAFLSAADELEELIGRVWSEVLDLPRVGMDDNYFDLGGTSISIKKAQLRLQSELDIVLPVAALYEYTTVRQLAEAIANSEV